MLNKTYIRIIKWIVLMVIIVSTSHVFAEPCGDVNSDGSIDIVDALLTAQHYVDLNPANFDKPAGDVNKDGITDILDALLIAQYYVGLIQSFPLTDETYDIIEITNDASVSLLNAGQVVWKAASTSGTIFLYDGSRTVQLANCSPPYYLRLGNLQNGRFVWIETDLDNASTLSYFDGNTIRRIGGTVGDKDYPVLDNGQIVWTQGPSDQRDVYFYDGNTIKRITEDGSCYSKAFLDDGQIVWTDKTDLFLFTGCSIERITIGEPSISLDAFDNGQILYSAQANNSEVLFLYDIKTRDTIRIIPDGANYHIPPAGSYFSTNLKNGKVAYTTYTGETWHPPTIYKPLPLYNLYVYENGVTTQISSSVSDTLHANGFDGSNLVWVEMADNQESIYLYDGQETTKISPDSSSLYSAQISNGDILWKDYKTIKLRTPHYEIPEITLEYQEGHTQSFSPSIEAGIRLINHSEGPADLNKITLKYWFTDETFPDKSEHEIYLLVDELDYSNIDDPPYPCVIGQWTMVSPVHGGDAYFRFGFTNEAGIISPGSSVVMEMSIHSTHWFQYDQSDDYSYNPDLTFYSPWEKITVYYQEDLIWGIEPF